VLEGNIFYFVMIYFLDPFQVIKRLLISTQLFNNKQVLDETDAFFISSV